MQPNNQFYGFIIHAYIHTYFYMLHIHVWTKNDGRTCRKMGTTHTHTHTPHTRTALSSAILLWEQHWDNTHTHTHRTPAQRYYLPLRRFARRLNKDQRQKKICDDVFLLKKYHLVKTQNMNKIVQAMMTWCWKKESKNYFLRTTNWNEIMQAMWT